MIGGNTNHAVIVQCMVMIGAISLAGKGILAGKSNARKLYECGLSNKILDKMFLIRTSWINWR